MAQEYSVGLLVSVRDKDRDAVVLQQRHPSKAQAAKTENPDKHDSWGNACQVTAHGKSTLEEAALGEPGLIIPTIERKLKEELGPELAGDIVAEMQAASGASVVQLNRVINKKGRIVITLGLKLDISAEDFLAKASFGEDVAGVKFLVDPSEIEVLEAHERESGVDRDRTVMFDDERQSVIDMFEHLRGPKAD